MEKRGKDEGKRHTKVGTRYDIRGVINSLRKNWATSLTLSISCHFGYCSLLVEWDCNRCNVTKVLKKGRGAYFYVACRWDPASLCCNTLFARQGGGSGSQNGGKMAEI